MRKEADVFMKINARKRNHKILPLVEKVCEMG